MKIFKSEKNIYRAVLLAAAVLLVLVNVFFAAATDRWNLKIDTTADKLYELSDTTDAILKGLNNETDIYVIQDKKSYPTVFSEIINRYAQLSDMINVQYISPYENPVFMDSCSQKGINLQESDILVSGAKGDKQITYDDMLVYSGENFTGIDLEQKLTSAIMYVNTEERLNVLFTTGHNERASASLESIFSDNNYTCTTSYISSENLDDYNIIVIASPTKDFTNDETRALSSYLDNGGKLMAFFEPGINSYDNLSALIEKWNIALHDNTVFESQLYTDGNPINIIPLYTTHAINTYFETNQYYVVMPSSRSIDMLTGSADVKVTPVLLTSSAAYSKEGSQYSDVLPEGEDEEGNFVLAAVAEKDSSGGAIFVAGSRYLYADDLMGMENYANSAFITQVVNYLCRSSTAVDIAPKTLNGSSIAVTKVQEVIIAAVFVAIIPLAILGYGISVKTRRNRL